MSSVTPMLSVYDGRQCGGFVLARGRASFEAFDATEHSLGGVQDAGCGHQRVNRSVGCDGLRRVAE